MDNFVYENRTKIIFGRDRVDEVGGECASYGPKVLIVTGGGSVERFGLRARAHDAVIAAGLTPFYLGGVTPNPDIAIVRAGAELCKKEGINFILAVGGGSVIDAAKGMAMGACYDGDPWDFFVKGIRGERSLPLGVVVTLAATGSEMNGNSVVSNRATREKRVLYHADLFPRFAILDPVLTMTVPADQTAYGAIDILSHVYEHYFHKVEETPLSDRLAEGVMKTVIENAPRALVAPDNYDARATLLWASTLALNGIIGAGTVGDWASHRIDHELSARYGITHGAGLAVIFPQWMRLCWRERPEKFLRFATEVWEVETTGKSDEEVILAGIDRMTAYYCDSLGVGVTLADYGVTEDASEELADAALAIGPVGRFRSIDRDELVTLYRDCL